MDLDIVKSSSKQLLRTIDRNSPTILTAVAVAGMCTTIAMAIRGTLKAKDILDHEASWRADEWSEQTGEHQSAYPGDFTTQEILELTWRCYIPTAGMTILTISSIIGANRINLRRNAALASLYSIAQSTLEEYQKKVVEEIGEKKNDLIRGEIAQDRIDKTPVEEKTVILTGNGNYLCFDAFSSRYFRSDIEKLRRAANSFNQRLLREGYLGINEFYDELGLEPIELGDEFGWIAERALLEMKFNTKTQKETMEPCLVIDYIITPTHI